MVGGNPRSGLANVFYPLSPRLTVLLGTIFTRGGAEDLHILDYIAEDDAFVLRQRAEVILQIDGPRRAALIAAELRKQFQFRGLLSLDQVDASWLLAALRGEQPTTIGIILSQLSTNTRARILSQLPPAVRTRVPPKEDLKATRLEIIRVVRQIFESRFAGMPSSPGEPTELYFKDVVLLDGRELVHLIRALGLEELGSAFLTIGKRQLAEVCARVVKEAAEELVGAVKQTEPRDAMDPKDATAFLQRMLLGLKLDEARGVNTDEARARFQRELFQKAGLFRLARSIRAERPIVVQQLSQRLPRSHGRLLLTYVDKMDEMIEYDDRKLRRLQDLVLYRVEKLAARGKVNPKFLKFTFCYWGDEEAAQEGSEVETSYNEGNSESEGGNAGYEG